jgi:tetratricopeptide (TPR) repeat protein
VSVASQVVIAYRRGPRWGAATLIHQALTHAGRSAIIDHLNGGIAHTQFQGAIRACRVFLPIFGPGDLDRCSQPDDPLLLALAAAFTSNCVVTPVLVDYFSYERNKQFLVGILTDLPKLQVVRIEPHQPYVGLEKLMQQIESRLDPVNTDVDMWLRSTTDTRDSLNMAHGMQAEVDAFCDNAEIAILQMDWIHAVSMLRRALEIGGDLARPWRVLGDLYSVRGAVDRSADAYTKAIDIDPNDLRAIERRMEINLRRGRTQQAYDDAAKAAIRGEGDTRVLAEQYASRFGSDSEHALKRILECIAKTNGETSEFRG